MPRAERQTSLAREKSNKDFAGRVVDRFNSFQERLKATKRWDRIKRSAERYHSESAGRDDTELQQGGSKGQLTLIQPNHYRSLVQAQLNLVTQATPSFEVAARTTDSEAVSEVKLGRGLIAYYQRLGGLAGLRVRRAESAIVTSESFLHAPWDSAAGRVHGVNSDGTAPVNEGDLTFGVHNLWHVAYDWMSKDLQRPREAILKAAVNRHDFAARFPKRRNEIMDAPPFCGDLEGHEYGDGGTASGDSWSDDYIGVYYYYAERTADSPEGRQSVVLDADCKPLDDQVLQVPRIPLFRLAPCERIYGPGGHTNNFEVLPLVEAYAAQISTILSNHATFAGQMIAAEQGSGVKPNHIGRSLTLLEYKAGTTPPFALDFLKTPPEVFELAELLMSQAEMLASVSSVNRGDVERSKGDSGSKSALFASVAQQMATSFFQALARSDEDLGQYIIETMQMRATAPRVAMIAGKNNAYSAIEFTKEKLGRIALVTVRASSPMRDTFEGRKELADSVRDMKGGPSTAGQYIRGLDTGNFEGMVNPEECEDTLISRENEELADPNAPAPRVARADNHMAHISGHKEGLNDPAMRRDAAAAKRFTDHVQWHVDCMTPGHPLYAGDAMLMATGQKALPHHSALTPPGDGTTFAPPPMPPGMPPANDNGGAPPGNEPPGPSPKVDAGGVTARPQAPGQPSLPSLPTNPATGQKAPPGGTGMEPPIAGAM